MRVPCLVLAGFGLVLLSSPGHASQRDCEKLLCSAGGSGISECQASLNDSDADASKCEEAGGAKVVQRTLIVSDPGCPPYSSWVGLQSRVVKYGLFKGVMVDDEAWWQSEPERTWSEPLECERGF